MFTVATLEWLDGDEKKSKMEGEEKTELWDEEDENKIKEEQEREEEAVVLFIDRMDNEPNAWFYLSPVSSCRKKSPFIQSTDTAVDCIKGLFLSIYWQWKALSCNERWQAEPLGSEED